MLKKRIPTIIGLLLLVIGAVSGVVFINQGTNFLPRAAPEYAPQKVKITNVSENGFVVSWITQDPTIGFVKWGETASSLSTTTTDDRDQLAGSSNEYRTHYISIQDLKPGATYYFKLGSQKNQLYDNNGQPFSITTPLTLGTPPPADTAYGTVNTAADTPAEGAIVYLSLDNATPVSALVKQNGNWAANLSTARTLDLSAYATYDAATTKIEIAVQPATGELTKVTTNTANDQPVPTITIGQTTDFSANTSPTPTTALGSPEPQAQATPTTDPVASPNLEPTPQPENKLSLQSLVVTEDKSITITSIPKDGAVVDTSKPEVGGKAPADAVLTITVHSSTVVSDQIQVSESGAWDWTPPADLEPGTHTVTVSYTDAEGILHQTSRDFVVADLTVQAVDLQYSASPSASTTPTPKPSPTPRSVVATESANVVAGSTTPTYFFLIVGLATLAFGSLILRKQ